MNTDIILSYLREKAYPAFSAKYAYDIPRMTRSLVDSLLDSLSEEELVELLDSLLQDQDAPNHLINEVRWHITRAPITKKVVRNEPVSRLLSWYNDKKSKKVSSSAAELKRRFSGQSFSVQKTILKSFLHGSRNEAEWAGRCLFNNWIPSFQKLIIDKWNETRLPIFAHVIILHLPEDVVFHNREDLSNDAGYAYVCVRLGNRDGFTVDESRLSPSEWFYVMAKLGREDAAPRMDEQMKACILAMTPEDLYLLREDSLLSVRSLGRVVWAMKKLHCTDHILQLAEMWDHALTFAGREEDDDDKRFALVFSLQQQVHGLPEDIKAYTRAKAANGQSPDYQGPTHIDVPIDFAEYDTDLPF